MKLKKIVRRLGGALLAGTLMVSMLEMSVLAEGTDTTSGEKTITVTKTVTKDSNVYAPKGNFKFLITPDKEQTVKNESGDPQNDSPAAGLSWTDENDMISFAPGNDDINKTSITNGGISLKVDLNKFSAPGQYRYKISEVKDNFDDGIAQIEGVGYTADDKYVDVYIGYEDNSTELSVLYFVVTDATEGTKTKVDFTNTYKHGNTENDLHTLTVYKRLDGNMADKNKAFPFTIQIDGDVSGEWYRYEVYDKNNTLVNDASGYIVSDDNNAVTFYLKGDQYVKVYGLSKNDKYTVTETDSDGHKTYVAYSDTTVISGADESNVASNKSTITADQNVTFFNQKDSGTDVNTGIILNIAPYILMVALAGILAFFFLRRRKSEF